MSINQNPHFLVWKPSIVQPLPLVHETTNCRSWLTPRVLIRLTENSRRSTVGSDSRRWKPRVQRQVATPLSRSGSRKPTTEKGHQMAVAAATAERPVSDPTV